MDRFLKCILVLAPLAWSLACCKADGPEPSPRNVWFDFGLTGGGRFEGSVSTVEVGVFDGEGNYLATERVGAEDMADRKGIGMKLAPGDYRLVFWGNMNGSTTVTDRVLYAPAEGDADPLFYAPSVNPNTTRADGSDTSVAEPYYELTVTGGKDFSDHVEFRTAHRELTLYVGGLDKTVLPKMYLTGIPAGLEYFGAAPHGGTVTLSRLTESVERDGVRYAAAMFRTMRFDNAEDVAVRVDAPDGTELFRSSLADLLGKAGLADNPETDIALVLNFLPTDDEQGGNANVSITLPTWEGGAIGVGINE